MIIQNSKKIVVSSICALMLCMPLAITGCSSGSSGSGSSENPAANYDAAPQDGQAPYKSEDEVQEELNRKVEEGMLDISIASVIRFENGSAEGTANIENVPGNHYDMKVTIENRETGEKYFESQMLKPNQHIEKIKLNKVLAKGTYPALANFYAYNTETGAEEGVAAAEITIEVEN